MIPILYPGNLLAPPSVVTPPGAAAGFPARRLYDGDVGLPWQDSGTGTRTILIDQGATWHPGGGYAPASARATISPGVTVTMASGPTSGALMTRATYLILDATVQRIAVPAQLDRWWGVTARGHHRRPRSSRNWS